MTDPNIPQPKTSADDEPISPVDPEDIKSFWKLKPPWGPGNDVQSACSPGADTAAVYRRWCMIQTLITYKLLTPWQHGEELDDAVFRIAATFSLREDKQKNYMIAGDEMFGFDPNAFVERLMEETRISHVWEPVATRISEGERAIVTTSVNFTGQTPNPERNAKYQARQVLWETWNRFAPSLDEVVSHGDKEQASEIVATFFADYLIENMGLVQQLVDSHRAGNAFGSLDLLAELERRAQRREM